MNGDLIALGAQAASFHGEIPNYPIHQAGDGFTSPINIGAGGISVMEYTVVAGVLVQLRYRLEVGGSGASLGAAFWIWKTDPLPFDLALPGTDVDAIGQNNVHGYGAFNDSAFVEHDGLKKLNDVQVSVADLTAAGIAKPAIGGKHGEGDNTMGQLNIGPAVPFGAAPAQHAVLTWSILAPLA